MDKIQERVGEVGLSAKHCLPDDELGAVGEAAPHFGLQVLPSASLHPHRLCFPQVMGGRLAGRASNCHSTYTTAIRSPLD